ncbi:hypothetical protein L1049_005107 [Liquidambar formosana]|uniref:Cyclin-like domain-containing protein n=1 Tax=Liquidambar formosana TaxID=63359 RepID=A0AAP0RQB8_LIQFO
MIRVLWLQPACTWHQKQKKAQCRLDFLYFISKKYHLMIGSKYEIKDILEMEMKILEALNYYLVVFHPYRALSQLLQDAGLNDIAMTHASWGIVNDTYKMDLILIHPPHLIALACIYIASVIKDKDTTVWFEELRVDMNVVKNISMEILDFYDNYKTLPDERINANLSKLALKP